MKVWNWMVVFVVGLFATFLEAREFTSTDGRKLNGEVIGVNETNVTLKVGARTFSVPKERFIDSDQEYFEQWLEEQAKNRVPKLELKVSSGKSNRRDAYDDELGDNRIGEFAFEVEIKNIEKNFDLKKAKAKLVAIGEDVYNTKRFIIMQANEFEVNVNYGETFSWKGSKVRYTFDDNKPTKWGHRIIGYALEIQNSSGKIILGKASPAKFAERVEELVKLEFSDGFDRSVGSSKKVGNYIDR